MLYFIVILTFIDEIIRDSGNENVVLHHIDLSSFQSVREFAKVINETESKIDVLIHNAGYVNIFRKAVSVDGIELTYATNHYGPFLLTHLLIDLLKKSAPCRIVVVASKTHTLSFFNPFKSYHLNPVGFLLPGLLYGNTKYANILMTFEMARRVKDFNITVNCLHPGRFFNFILMNLSLTKVKNVAGVIDTGIWRNIPFPFSFVMDFARLFLKTLQEGIQTILYCSLSSDLEGVSGKYFRDCKEGKPLKGVHDRDWQTKLWDESVKIVKLTENDPKI